LIYFLWRFPKNFKNVNFVKNVSVKYYQILKILKRLIYLGN